MHQIHRENNGTSAKQKCQTFIKPKVRSCDDKGLAPDSLPSQVNPVYELMNYFFKMHTFHITLRSKPRLHNLPLTQTNSVRISHGPCVHCTSRPFNITCFGHPDNGPVR